jgi:hypothetical protein
MTKKKKGSDIDYSKVSEDLVKMVEDVIADSKKHVFSISKIYSAYNSAYGLNEKPQGCSSCLQRRVNMLKDWISGYNAFETKKVRGGIAGLKQKKSEGGIDEPEIEQKDADKVEEI